MKKLSVIAALLVGAAVIFSFAGCSQPSSSSDEDKSSATTGNTDAGSEGNGGNGGGETPAPVVTYTITIADGITNGSVTASKTSGISAGETITLTITPEESDSYDCAFVTLSVKNGNDDVTVNGTGNTRTFTMPAANVNVDATFSKTTYIGNKKPSVAKAVGDIVFNDGSAMPYSAFDALGDDAKEAKKTSAIALIFYKGTGLNSGNDTTTSRTLGVGLKDKSGLSWCSDNAKAYGLNITTIQCKSSGSTRDYTFTDSTANDRNGSDNLEQIASFLTEADGVTDDTTGDGASNRYPAFYFAKNYKDTAENISGTEYESGWYLPSIAELFQIYANGIGTNRIYDIDTALEALGGNKFGTYTHWSSSQKFLNGTVYVYKLLNGGVLIAVENYYCTGWVCVIREFN